VEGYAPEGAEDDDAGHVEGPAGEAVFFAHLGFAHGVEEELQVPGESGDGGEQVIHLHGGAGLAACGDAGVFGEGLVAGAEDQAPDAVGDEAAAEDDDEDGESLVHDGGPVREREEFDGAAGVESKGEAGAHDAAEGGDGEAEAEVELGDVGFLLLDG